MDYGRKKKLTFITIGLIFLLSGVEYAVILPTIWRFLQTLDAAPYFLGLSLSAFSFSGLLSGPLFGFWSDRTHGSKKIILFANCFEIIGNFMYFLGFSKWLLLSSRFVAGIGTGAGSSIFGFLTRITAPEDRSTVFAAVMACRQAGLLIGPAFNLFLRLCDFQLGPFVVNKYTAPGIFMCVLWLLLQLIVLLMYYDLSGRNEGSEEEKQEEEERLLVQSNDTPESYGTLPNSPAMDHAIANGNLTPPDPPSEQIKTSAFQNFSAARAEYLREEVVVLLTAQFITLFNQTALETMVTPLTQQYFNFGELENSVMYCVCGVEVIAGFVFVRWLSKKVEERVVLSIGLLLANISCVWCIIFLANPQGGFSWQLTEFIIGVFLQVLGLPFIAVAQVSLFSKVTAEKTQGFSQGIRRSVGGLATILGPLWAGSLTSNLYVMLGVMTGLLVLFTIMMAFSYKRLVEHTTVEHTEE
ncbi:major facilitator superfamily domain-containing protein 8 isoform X1 [Silurus meridionalis]|uniref:major facilitator superfamily domain-containing protein 8 isoform X1 n=1 Tax=Silurus meridionalis TaxID=175797 RepID=UPI001EE9B45E|nr:major facilitator superfamily domain-containing protein 8 isoform X1 [Silurus meridionalis]XP_046714374.1 major facilitator superfamily domain-containing protein 8 isoform X1 [Silurus meridionalis]XP_046714376.1 major facilitator superfamily domain-containing protein 8 isoform X1 [Silurus meridionalis]XP_046714377.1 major facilitator superfamily domain-containing protein 8 isoform X1 [Silurus meridionalis]